LAEQAANGTLSLEQRRALDQEANALVEEFNRILQSVSFNSQHIYDITDEPFRLATQAGYGTEGQVTIELGDDLFRTAGILPAFSINPVSINYTLTTLTASGSGLELNGMAQGDFNGDGVLDFAVAIDDADEMQVFI